MTVSVVDLFCGGGGFSEGARRAGCHVVLAVDSDVDAMTVHQVNHPDAEHVITTLPSDDVVRRVAEHVARGAHVHASPPCQMLSQANRRVKATSVDHSLSLVQWYIDLVLSQRPASWTMEQVNVPVVCRLLQRARMRHPECIDFLVVDVADFGVPQNRRRVVAGSPPLIERLRQCVGEGAKHRVCVRDVVPDAPGSHIQSTTTNTPVRDSTGRTISHRPLRPEEHIRSTHGPSYTILARNAPWWSDDTGTRIRHLTPNECALIQTFSPSYDLMCVKTSVAQRVVGNAVPPKLATVIMRAACTIRSSSSATCSPPSRPRRVARSATVVNPSESSHGAQDVQ